MISPPEWVQDLPSLLNGDLARAGFTWRLEFPCSSHPLAVPCLIAYSLALHTKPNYPVVQDFLDISWKPTVQPILSYATEADWYEKIGQWWEGLGQLTLETLEKLLGDHKSTLLRRVRAGAAITFNDTNVLTHIANLMRLAIVWIENQDEGPLTHLFINQKKQDPALFVYLLQSNRTISLLFHGDFDQPPNSNAPEKSSTYMLVGGRVQPYTFGVEAGQSQERDLEQTAVELAKDAERRMVETALKLISDWYPYGVPSEASPSLNQFQEAISRYQSIARRVEGPVIDVSPLLDVLSQPPMNRKRLPRQHNLSECQSSLIPGELKTTTCGHTFHTSCLRVYLNLELRHNGVPCPLCPHHLSEELIACVSPQYHKQLQLLKTESMQVEKSRSVHAPSALPQDDWFLCKWCQNMKQQKGTTHGCMVCFECMKWCYFEGLCGECNRQFNDEDRLLAQVSLNK